MVVFMVFAPDRVEELGGLSAAERFCYEATSCGW
jgi:hypothetical protein